MFLGFLSGLVFFWGSDAVIAGFRFLVGAGCAAVLDFPDRVVGMMEVLGGVLMYAGFE